MTKTSEYYINSTNGVDKLRVMKWEPSDSPVAVLQISHGIAEHIERYSLFAQFLAENGIVVVGNDHLGHGYSCGENEPTGFFAEKDGWNTVVDDIHALFTRTRAEHPGVPYFLLGHSMGSFLARTYIIRYGDGLDGCILSGTGNQSALLLNSGRALCKLETLRKGKRSTSSLVDKACFGVYNKRIDPVRTKNDWISRDDKIVDEYGADPRCGFVPSIGLVNDMLGGIKFITKRENIDKIDKKLPIYIFSGDMDPVGEYGKGVTRAYSALRVAGCEDVSIKLYPGGRHEMLNETNRQEVYEDTLGWITSKLLQNA